uniref:Uncharacterized protein n=1 Tax=Meloidogyne hapla TaxID=6305 RepID=A0A1I8BN20_MELHA
MAPSSLFINQDNEIINFLTLVEKNAQLIRNSPKRVPNWHYNSFNSIETLITRKENIIASSHEYLYQQQNFLPLEVIEYIRKNGFFTMPPSALMEDLLLIVDIGKTMPFFDHLDLNEKGGFVSLIITRPLFDFNNTNEADRLWHSFPPVNKKQLNIKHKH